MTAVDLTVLSSVRKPAYTVTPLLEFLTGEHAQNVAAIWLAPHEGFFALPTARRHAAAMLLAGLGVEPVLSMRAIRQLVERGRDKAVAAALIGDRDAAGFMKTLTKAGERLWPKASMAHLMELYREPGANRVIRHMAYLTPGALDPMVALVPALRDAKVVQHVPDTLAAKDLSLAFKLVERIRGSQALSIAVQRWTRADTPQALFTKASEDLVPDAARLWQPPPVLPNGFEHITTVKALRATAIEFQNCLGDFVFDIGKGRMAVYVLRGEPNAVMAITWNVDGWRLAEAEAADNEPLGEDVLLYIAKVFKARGVRTGPAVETLQSRLQEHGRVATMQTPPDRPVPTSLQETLDLGELWR